MGINRRDFMKIGLAGTTSVFLGWEGLADAVQIAAGPFVFPEPVYRTLGRTGLKITTISFGAMLTPESEVIEIAFDHGVNYVDTARRYMGGRNEETVGRALKGKRDRVYVATKIPPASRSKEAISKDVETSLRELGTDYVDVIQLHNVNSREDRIFNPEIRETLVRLKEQGKVRFFGVTSHTNEAEVLNALADDKDKFFDTALVKYNFKSSQETREAIGRAARANIGIIAMKALAGGYTTEKPGPLSPYQSAIKWVLQDRHVTAVIPGMRNIAELREDIAVMGTNFGYLDNLLLRRYGAAVAPYYCHLCGQCEASCPKGVAISSINRCLMYLEAYKSPGLARSTYQEIPSSLSASSCLNCDCAVKCVNGLDVAAKMDTARKWLA